MTQKTKCKICVYFINSWIWNTLKPGVRRLDKGGYPLDLGLVWYELEREFMFQTMKRQKMKGMIHHVARAGSLVNFFKKYSLYVSFTPKFRWGSCICLPSVDLVWILWLLGARLIQVWIRGLNASWHDAALAEISHPDKITDGFMIVARPRPSYLLMPTMLMLATVPCPRQMVLNYK